MKNASFKALLTYLTLTSIVALLLALTAMATQARAQTLIPAPGCITGVPCSAAGIALSGPITFATDDLYDIGTAIGTTRPRNIYVGNVVVIGNCAIGGNALCANGNIQALGVIPRYTQTDTISTGNLGSSGATDFSKFSIPAFTNNDPTATGTSAFWVLANIGQPTLMATNTRTYTAAVSLYIAAPQCSTNVTCTSTYAVYSAGNMRVTGTLLANNMQIVPGTVSALPTCNVGNDGMRSSVTDSTLAVFAMAVVGGSTLHVPVYCDGSGTPAWKIG